MKNTRIRKKPKSKKNVRRAKKRLARSLKVIRKKSDRLSVALVIQEDPDFIGVIKSPSGLWSYDNQNKKFNGVHSEFFGLQDYNWIGLITLKFHLYSYSKHDHQGKGRENRMKFFSLFMDNLRSKLGISDREFLWVVCEEFGFSRAGHLHALFSFDYLKEKNRMDRLKIFDFSEKGDFWAEGQESVEFVSRKNGINSRTVDFNWRPMWENEGLVGYFCKKEFGHEEKFFEMSEGIKKHVILRAA